eukprot:CAMPEP_0198589670 /NCGR_PEP_ID=MMETSP1462-20131121/134699_1 /TAXON_ID=1333877 /ORGANISM="Brandtodinium nutriculum, Strain RCC3387" /LENGTH=64 /DNA_ID=CAMNT_0044321191 /DNA_START=18 /DNA_END=208 /DNA_ORIENTATION=+
MLSTRSGGRARPAPSNFEPSGREAVALTPLGALPRVAARAVALPEVAARLLLLGQREEAPRRVV